MRQHWPILVGCHLALAGAVSPVFAAVYGLFIGPMSGDLGWSRSQLAFGMSLFISASTIATPFAGHFLDRFGAGAASLIAMVALPLAIVFLAMAPPGWPAFLAACVLIGLVGSLTLPVTYVSILPQWFDGRLGLAMALTVSGLGTGAIVSAMLASRVIVELGWQGAWIAMAIWSGLLTFMGRSLIPWRSVVKREPRQSQSMDENAAGLESVKFATDPRFWFITLAFMLGLLVTLAVQTNVPAALIDRGLSPAFAGTVIAATGLASCLARLLGGALLDWFPVRFVGFATFGLQAAGCLLLAFSPHPLAVIAGAALVAFAYGVEADMIPYVIRRRYGVARLGRIYGVMYGTVQVGAIFGPTAVAVAADSLGAYTLPFLALAACSFTASFAILLAATQSSRPDHEEHV